MNTTQSTPPAEPAPHEAAVLTTERDGRILVLTLNRPERLNALTRQLHARLHEAVAAAARDPDVGAVILTGAGRAFCSGGDMSAGKGAGPAPTLEERADELLAIDEALRRLAELDAAQAQLVEMHFFGGMSFEEAAEALRISSITAKRRWASARAWLITQLAGADRRGFTPAIALPASKNKSE